MLMETAAVDVEYVPAGQLVQKDAPELSWNLPAAQSWHCSIAVAPAVVRYLPATHAVQVMLIAFPVAAGPQWLATQVHFDRALAVPSAGEVAR